MPGQTEYNAIGQYCILCCGTKLVSSSQIEPLLFHSNQNYSFL